MCFLILLCSSQSGLCETVILPESRHPRLGVHREALHPPFFLSGIKFSLQHSLSQDSCQPLTPCSTRALLSGCTGSTPPAWRWAEHPSCPSVFKRLGEPQLLSDIRSLWNHRVGGTWGFGKTAWAGRHWTKHHNTCTMRAVRP